jgi:tetratricopeptide (TPR) repeat protein
LNVKIHIYELTFVEMKRVFVNSFEGGRFVPMLSFAVNYYFNRLDVFGYHLVNFLIHFGMAASIYFFTMMTLTLPSTRERYGKYARKVAVGSALLFIVHPIQTQAVTYIVQRMTSMAALFYMLAMLAYIKGRQENSRYRILFFALCAFSGVLGFGSKQNTVVLPAAVLLYEVYFFQKGNLEFIKKRAGLVAILLLVPIITAMAYTRMNFIAGFLDEYAKRDFTMLQRVLTEQRVLLHYFVILFYPHPSMLNLDYDFSLSNSLFGPPSTFLSLFILFWIFYLAVYLYRREPLVSFGIFWFYGNLFLESSILALDIVNEHRLYLPSVTFFMIFVYFFVKFMEKTCKNSNNRNIITIIFLSTVLMIFCSWTYQRNDVWQSVISILEDVTVKSPQKARQVINLGVAYSNAAEYEKAINAFRQSIKLDPKYPEAHNNLGNVYNKMGQYNKAITEYTKALIMRPNYNEAYNNMGSAYTKMRNFQKAIELHKAALQINPKSEKTYNNLGVAYSNAGDVENAIKSYQSSIRINPHFLNARINLGMMYRTSRQFDKAIKVFNEALGIFSADAGLYFNLGDTYAAMKKTERALYAYNRALQINPNYPEAINNIGLLFMNNKRFDEAINQYQKAIALQDRPEFHYNLALSYREKGLYQLAEQEFRKMIAARPNFFEAYFNLGLLYERIGYIDQAIRTYEEGLKRKPNQLELLNQLAGIYLNQKKDSPKALEYYRKIVQVAPDHPNVKEVKNLIARLEKEKPSLSRGAKTGQ